MSESSSAKQRQTSATNIGSTTAAAGNTTGSNRSRRSSWSDSKVRNLYQKVYQLFVYFYRKFGMLVMRL
jgi:hypothetical protein